MKTWREFEEEVIAVVRRFFAQNGRPAPDADELAGFAARLAAVVAQRGLPRPLSPGECGTPGSLPDDVIAALLERAVATGADPLLRDAAKQLVKACFYPEFTQCRDSYRERAKDGACRRQEFARVRGRISGTHCVDCPFWVTHEADSHAVFLGESWVAGRDAFIADRSVYIPEDFRRLRRWLHAAAREGTE
jgi:hypothetical protein